jgi:hypothetical protein
MALWNTGKLKKNEGDRHFYMFLTESHSVLAAGNTVNLTKPTVKGILMSP